jgi:hypothetical protein
MPTKLRTCTTPARQLHEGPYYRFLALGFSPLHLVSWWLHLFVSPRLRTNSDILCGQMHPPDVPFGIPLPAESERPGSGAGSRRSTGITTDLGLALAKLWPHTRTMTEEEIRQRVKEILLKRDLGDDLTAQEERILAYAY